MDVIIDYSGGIDPDLDKALKDAIPGEVYGADFWPLHDKRQLWFINVIGTVAAVGRTIIAVCGDRLVGMSVKEEVRLMPRQTH